MLTCFLYVDLVVDPMSSIILLRQINNCLSFVFPITLPAKYKHNTYTKLSIYIEKFTVPTK